MRARHEAGSARRRGISTRTAERIALLRVETGLMTGGFAPMIVSAVLVGLWRGARAKYAAGDLRSRTGSLDAYSRCTPSACRWTGGFVLAGSILLMAGSQSQAETFTLSDALSLAYETNPQLAQARAALEALDQGVAQANAGWRPSINASVSEGYDHGTVNGFGGALNSQPLIGQVTLSQPIFRGGRTYAEIGRAIAQVHAGRAQLVATEQSVLLAAVTAYADVVRDTATLKVGRDNFTSLEAELKAVRTQFSAGAVTRTDAQQAEARLERARSDVALAENQLEASRAAFASVIGRPAETLEVAVALPRLPATKDVAVATALKTNPELVQARANERAAYFAIVDAAGALLPQISVSGQYQFLRDAPNASIFGLGNQQQVTSVLAQINVPIYQGGAEEATVRRAKDAHAQTELAIVSAQREVSQNLDSAWQALQSFAISIAANKAQTVADEGAVSGIRQEQQGGERSVIDVLNAQQELFVAQTALAASQHDRVVAAYKLLSVIGGLTAQSLGLKVALYDPEIHYQESADAWFGFGK